MSFPVLYNINGSGSLPGTQNKNQKDGVTKWNLQVFRNSAQ